jgi:hypothetical protein
VFLRATKITRPRGFSVPNALSCSSSIERTGARARMTMREYRKQMIDMKTKTIEIIIIINIAKKNH